MTNFIILTKFYELNQNNLKDISTCMLNKKFKIKNYHIGRKQGQIQLIPLNLYRPSAYKVNQEDNQITLKLDILNEKLDLLNKKREREVFSFLSRLNREYINNVALFSVYSHSNKMMKHVVSYCQKQDLPLLRDLYSVQVSFSKELPPSVLQGGRVYVDDMVNIVNNYY